MLRGVHRQRTPPPLPVPFLGAPERPLAERGRVVEPGLARQVVVGADGGEELPGGGGRDGDEDGRARASRGGSGDRQGTGNGSGRASGSERGSGGRGSGANRAAVNPRLEVDAAADGEFLEERGGGEEGGGDRGPGARADGQVVRVGGVQLEGPLVGVVGDDVELVGDDEAAEVLVVPEEAREGVAVLWENMLLVVYFFSFFLKKKKKLDNQNINERC